MATNNSMTDIRTTLEAVFSFADFSAFLTLFGDEATKQFLATSISTLDTLLLGIAPLGIMTIIVSAIRIGGSPLMKSVIGRARDSPDDEEKELLSSTSSNVREIWDGNRVVRQTGESKTIPLVYNSKDKSLLSLCDHPRFISPSPKTYRESGLIWYVLSSIIPRKLLRIPRQEIERLPRDISPNLTLNTPNGIPKKMTAIFLVIIGLMIQAAVVLINALAVYRWQWVKSGKPVERYAYPLWAAGTGAIAIGVWLCGWVVESSSEKVFVTGDDGGNGQRGLNEDDFRIIFMQKKLPAQNIPAYAIEPISSGKKMMYSRRLWPSTLDHSPARVDMPSRAREHRVRVTCVAIGSLLTLFGFVCQNIGTRGLHWSAGLLQLGATAALTILRAVIRRNVGRLVDDKHTNTIEELENGFEVCHLSTKLIGSEIYLASTLTTVREPTPTSKKGHCYTILEIDEDQIALGDDDDDKYKNTISKTFEAQTLLTQYMPEVKHVKKAAANCLKAMDDILELIFPGNGEAAWYHIGPFLWIAVNDVGKGAAACSTHDDGETFPKFRPIKAPTRRNERLQLLQALISSTSYTYRGMWKFTPAFRILGYCARGDIGERRRLLSAWLEPRRMPKETSRVQIGQPTATEAGIPNEYWRERAILFGLPLSRGFWSSIYQDEIQEQLPSVYTLELLWRDGKINTLHPEGFLTLQIALDIISSFMLRLASSDRHVFVSDRMANKDELCESLENIIERNGVCKQGGDARLAVIPALVSFGILKELPQPRSNTEAHAQAQLLDQHSTNHHSKTA